MKHLLLICLLCLLGGLTGCSDTSMATQQPASTVDITPLIRTGIVFNDTFSEGVPGSNYPAVLKVGVNNADMPLSENIFRVGIYSQTEGRGDNTHFIGQVAIVAQARDRIDVTDKTKGVLYGILALVAPRINRDNVPFDDVVAVAMRNEGTAKGTDMLYGGHNASIAGSEFGNAIKIDTHADRLFSATGTYKTGIDFGEATISGAALYLAPSHIIAFGEGAWLYRSGNDIYWHDSSGHRDVRLSH